MKRISIKTIEYFDMKWVNNQHFMPFKLNPFQKLLFYDLENKSFEL